MDESFFFIDVDEVDCECVGVGYRYRGMGLIGGGSDLKGFVALICISML